jgi:hypothetical protein
MILTRVVILLNKSLYKSWEKILSYNPVAVKAYTNHLTGPRQALSVSDNEEALSGVTFQVIIKCISQRSWGPWQRLLLFGYPASANETGSSVMKS